MSDNRPAPQGVSALSPLPGLRRLAVGEMAALPVGRIDFLRRRVLVSESVTPVKGVMAFGRKVTRGARCRSPASWSAS